MVKVGEGLARKASDEEVNLFLGMRLAGMLAHRAWCRGRCEHVLQGVVQVLWLEVVETEGSRGGTGVACVHMLELAVREEVPQCQDVAICT